MTTADPAHFDAATREEEIAAWVAACPRTRAARAALVSILPEQHPVYAGRSTSETTRIRGYAVAAFERVGLPGAAVPYVLDELQNGDDAYLVAAAAKALRGARTPADIGFAVPFLATARENIRYADAPVTFDEYKPRVPTEHGTTAAQEIQRTREWIGEAECCEVPLPPVRGRASLALEGLALEDQDGRTIRFADFFTGKPSIVAFFYTRCDNVRKCSLTVTRLASLQRELAARGLDGQVRVSAITYDPHFDRPARMRTYGRERGVVFGDDVRFFRVNDGFDALRTAFDLGVNYVGAIVNRHRIEVYVLDARGRVARTFTRLTWDERDLTGCVERLLRRSALQRAASDASASAAAIAIALLPKCPLCLGAYASALGVAGLQLAPHRAWLLPLAVILVAAHLVTLWRRAGRTRRFAPIAVSAAATVALVAGSVSSLPVLSLTGAAMAVAGAVLSTVARDQRSVEAVSRRLMLAGCWASTKSTPSAVMVRRA